MTSLPVLSRHREWYSSLQDKMSLSPLAYTSTEPLQLNKKWQKAQFSCSISFQFKVLSSRRKNPTATLTLPNYFNSATPYKALVLTSHITELVHPARLNDNVLVFYLLIGPWVSQSESCFHGNRLYRYEQQDGVLKKNLFSQVPFFNQKLLHMSVMQHNFIACRVLLLSKVSDIKVHIKDHKKACLMYRNLAKCSCCAAEGWSKVKKSIKVVLWPATAASLASTTMNKRVLKTQKMRENVAWCILAKGDNFREIHRRAFLHW